MTELDLKISFTHRCSNLAAEVNLNSIPRNMELEATPTFSWLMSRMFTHLEGRGLAFSQAT